ncbi:MAG: hypothetical protein ACLTYN_13225 [Dysosmobacter welbionis]
MFTIYLSIVRIISGSADSATVKVAKAAISGVVPVVEASSPTRRRRCWPGRDAEEHHRRLRDAGHPGACAYPFLQLGSSTCCTS